MRRSRVQISPVAPPNNQSMLYTILANRVLKKSDYQHPPELHMQLKEITVEYTTKSTAINTNARIPNNITPSAFICEPDVIGDDGLKVLLHLGHLNLP